MKKTLFTLLFATVAIAATTPTASARVKKNPPRKREALAELEKLAQEDKEYASHYVNKMRIYNDFTLEYEDDNGDDLYYHFFYVDKKSEDGYRILVYDNTPTYLGYYDLRYEPTDYEEGTLIIDTEEVIGNNDDSLSYFPFPKKGPPKTVRLGGVYPMTFVPNPKLEKKENKIETGGIPPVPKEVSASGDVIEYRDWNITIKGNTVTVNAKFVRIEKNKVVIKSSKTGKEATIPGSALSEADKAYVAKITTEK